MHICLILSHLTKERGTSAPTPPHPRPLLRQCFELRIIDDWTTVSTFPKATPAKFVFLQLCCSTSLGSLPTLYDPTNLVNFLNYNSSNAHIRLGNFLMS